MSVRGRLAAAAAALLVAGGALAGDAAGLTSNARGANGGDWPRFGDDPARSDVAPAETLITPANVAGLTRTVVPLEGTVDSSPIYLQGASIAGQSHDALFVTTTYGKTLALDAQTGAELWRYVPAGIARWEGTGQITTATPVADPDRRYLYAASPDGLIHKLRVADGREVRAGGWPALVTRDPAHEKIAAALNLAGPVVIVATGGYIGDAPPYQGHVVAIARSTGRLEGVFNTLCTERRALISPPSCPATRSAIWARAGAVVEPGTRRLLVATGNGPWDGRRNWGDSVLELSPDARRLLQSWTPRDQAELNATDADLGSTAPAILPHGRAPLLLQGGKDGKLRLLGLARLNGRTDRAGPITGGELQTLSAPGGAPVFTAPAVSSAGGRVTAFVAGDAGTAAYVLRGRPARLATLWRNATAGTSPVLAGGLLYVYDPDRGGLNVYLPTSGRRVAGLPAGTGHWNSPIVVDGRVALPEGNANDHATTGTLSLYTLPPKP